MLSAIPTPCEVICGRIETNSNKFITFIIKNRVNKPPDVFKFRKRIEKHLKSRVQFRPRIFFEIKLTFFVRFLAAMLVSLRRRYECWMPNPTISGNPVGFARSTASWIDRSAWMSIVKLHLFVRVWVAHLHLIEENFLSGTTPYNCLVVSKNL